MDVVATLPPSRAGRAALAVSAVLTAVHLVLTLLGVGGWWRSDALYNAALLASLVALVVVRLRRPPTGRQDVTGLLVVAFAAQSVGELGWSWLVLQGREPFPSLVDAAYMAWYPPVCAAVVVGVRARVATVSAWQVLDGVLAASAAVALGLVVVVGPLADSEGSVVTQAVTLAYPCGNVAVLALVVGGLSVLGWRASPGLWLVLAGVALIASGSSAYALALATEEYVNGGLLDPLYPVATLAVAAGVVLRGAPQPVRTPSGLRVLTAPAGSAAVACAVLLLAAGGSGAPSGAAPMAAATLVGCFVRAGGLLREVEHLPETQRQAFTDELTGLDNRRALQRLLDDRLRPDAGPPPRTVLFVVDLDGFKRVNDTLGHAQGDALLVAVASRLRGLVGEGEAVVRLGGDEFAVVLRDRSAASVQAVADEVVAAVGRPVHVDGMDVSVGCSVGVAVAPSHARTREELLRCADAAMYVAKRQGGGISVFHATSVRSGRGDLALLTQLRAGIAAGELVLHHQPVVDVRTRSQVGTEALVRWQHPVLGLLPPDRFVPVAESNGLARPLTDAVLDMALAHVAGERRRGRTTRVAVNVPAPLLHDAGLPDRVAAMLSHHGVPATCLTVEITETGLLPDGDGPLSTTAALRAQGVEVSVDDYGTGYTSVASLRQLDVSEMKLDRSLLLNAVRDVDGARAILQSTVELAHALGLQVVGEGVETEEQLELLRALGVERAQGYLLGRPAPARAEAVLPVPPPRLPSGRAAADATAASDVDRPSRPAAP